MSNKASRIVVWSVCLIVIGSTACTDRQSEQGPDPILEEDTSGEQRDTTGSVDADAATDGSDLQDTGTEGDVSDDGGDTAAPVATDASIVTQCCSFVDDDTGVVHLTPSAPSEIARFEVTLEDAEGDAVPFDTERHEVQLETTGDTGAFNVESSGAKIRVEPTRDEGSIQLRAEVSTPDLKLSTQQETVRIGGLPEGNIEYMVGYAVYRVVPFSDGTEALFTDVADDFAPTSLSREPQTIEIHRANKVRFEPHIYVLLRNDAGEIETWTSHGDPPEEFIDLTIEQGPGRAVSRRDVRFEESGDVQARLRAPELDTSTSVPIRAVSDQPLRAIAYVAKTDDKDWYFPGVSTRDVGSVRPETVDRDMGVRIHTGNVTLGAGGRVRARFVAIQNDEDLIVQGGSGDKLDPAIGIYRPLNEAVDNIRTAGDTDAVEVEKKNDGTVLFRHAGHGVLQAIVEARGIGLPFVAAGLPTKPQQWSLEASPTSVTLGGDEPNCKPIDLTLSGPDSRQVSLSGVKQIGVRCLETSRKDTKAECEVGYDGVSICYRPNAPFGEGDSGAFEFEYLVLDGEGQPASVSFQINMD